VPLDGDLVGVQLDDAWLLGESLIGELLEIHKVHILQKISESVPSMLRLMLLRYSSNCVGINFFSALDGKRTHETRNYLVHEY
jgi:hypothetical protein